MTTREAFGPRATIGRPSLGRRAVAGIGMVLLWWARSQQRRALMQLDDRMLRDIGVSRYDAVREARKPFWKA